jgi:hypothetical protein
VPSADDPPGIVLQRLGKFKVPDKKMKLLTRGELNDVLFWALLVHYNDTLKFPGQQ